MKHYQVEIVESLSTIVVVKAESKEDALEMVRQMHTNEEIILTSDDFADVEFRIKQGTISPSELI